MVELVEIQDVIDKSFQVIDTRSEIEFQKDHMPCAVNIPILNTKERHEIGILYKKNPDEAIKKGYALYYSKESYYKKELAKLSKEKEVLVYCFRGGMRSEGFSAFVESCGFSTKRLKGGYKAYRRYVMDYFENFDPSFDIVVLQGLTGCGKTELIRALPSVDLEKCANHRSSLFGGIGLTPHTQKMFESLLFDSLRKVKTTIFMEGENKKIGNVLIPSKVYEKMISSPTLEITSPIDLRCKRIVADYSTYGEDEKIISIIKKLKQPLGVKTVEKLLDLMKNKEYHHVAKILLEEYYDHRYNHAMKEMEFVDSFENVKGTISAIKEKYG